MDKKKSTGLLLSVLGVLSLVLITAGVTYAFFSYTKQGTTDNVLKTGTLTFLYTEKSAGIDIKDATPISDTLGKQTTGFDFVVTSDTTSTAEINYDVTARKMAGGNSIIAEDQVKVYLTADKAGTTLTNDPTANPVLFSDLQDYTKYEDAIAAVTLATGQTEKLIYTGKVDAGQAGYSNGFNLKMWIKGLEEGETGTSADYSPYEFVLKTASQDVTTPLNADTLITKGQLITSTAYYALDEATQANYERIAYVNTTDRTILTVSQVAAGATTDGMTAGEQFYQLNAQTFTVRVNVYANAAVVNNSGTTTE